MSSDWVQKFAPKLAGANLVMAPSERMYCNWTDMRPEAAPIRNELNAYLCASIAIDQIISGSSCALALICMGEAAVIEQGSTALVIDTCWVRYSLDARMNTKVCSSPNELCADNLSSLRNYALLRQAPAAKSASQLIIVAINDEYALVHPSSKSTS